jgi:(p)ppGpp synthase/HD superfamily hydrolase
MSFNEFLQEKSILIKAQEFATQKHLGQKRKFNGSDYITHPASVAELVSHFGGNTEMIAAAWLHDVVEDTNTSIDEIKKEFGSKIANFVNELTNPTEVEKNGNKSKYIADKMPQMSDESLTIKLCDRLNNVSDFKNADKKWANKYANKTRFIINSLKDSGRSLNINQQKIVSEIEKLIKPFENYKNK